MSRHTTRISLQPCQTSSRRNVSATSVIRHHLSVPLLVSFISAAKVNCPWRPPVAPLEMIKKQKIPECKWGFLYSYCLIWSNCIMRCFTFSQVQKADENSFFFFPHLQASWSPPFPQRENFKHGLSCCPSSATCSTLKTTTPARSKPNLP